MQLPDSYHLWMSEFEDRHRWFLKIEQIFWRIYDVIRHPRQNYYDRRKWKNRPVVGDKVIDCANRVQIVAKIDGDDLYFEDGNWASWMGCCEPYYG